MCKREGSGLKVAEVAAEPEFSQYLNYIERRGIGRILPDLV